jgi:hypothetical protein
LNRKQAQLALPTACFTLAPFLAYSQTLKMEVTYSTETTFGFQQYAWHYIPEETALHSYRSEIPKSIKMHNLVFLENATDRLCGLVVRVPGYRIGDVLCFL